MGWFCAAWQADACRGHLGAKVVKVERRANELARFAMPRRILPSAEPDCPYSGESWTFRKRPIFAARCGGFPRLQDVSNLILTMMKLTFRDLILLLIILALFLPFFLSQSLYEAYHACNENHAILIGGVKFALLSTIGEVIALRIRTGGYVLKGFGVFPRMVVWFFLGAWIVMAMRIFGAGAPLLADYVFNAGGAIAEAMNQPVSWNKFVGAFFISLLQNTAFAPVFMTLHKITDTHIMQCGGGLRAFVTPVKFGEIMAGMNWRVQWNFVFKKTIPFFWIPAHTVTFMLPGEFQVLFAAFLGVVLGIILAFAANK